MEQIIMHEGLAAQEKELSFETPAEVMAHHKNQRDLILAEFLKKEHEKI